MNRYRFAQLLGVVVLVGAGVLFWESYVRAICSVELGSRAERCVPNLDYLLGGVGIAVVGVVLFGYGWWKLWTIGYTS